MKVFVICYTAAVEKKVNNNINLNINDKLSGNSGMISSHVIKLLLNYSAKCCKFHDPLSCRISAV